MNLYKVYKRRRKVRSQVNKWIRVSTGGTLGDKKKRERKKSRLFRRISETAREMRKVEQSIKCSFNEDDFKSQIRKEQCDANLNGNDYSNMVNENNDKRIVFIICSHSILYFDFY